MQRSIPSPAPQPSLARKVRFLTDPKTYPHAPKAVRVIETHMSYVFLAGSLVYKLKKPVRFPHLDFSTPEQRKRMVRKEIRLNRRLAPDVYLGERALHVDVAGALSLGGEGRSVDWLVEMRRLPGDRTLNEMIVDMSIVAIAQTQKPPTYAASPATEPITRESPAILVFCFARMRPF